MVYYFDDTVTDPPSRIYMGKDKYENEQLIKYGWDENVWFHVDGLSSAHIYLRLPKGHNARELLEELEGELIKDCAQLTKANSIEGHKRQTVDVVYTPWSNLKKTPEMEIGAVHFHNEKLVKRIQAEGRDKQILNRLEKTRQEVHPNWEQEKRDRISEKHRMEREGKRKKLQQEKKMIEEEKQLKALRSYSGLLDNNNLMKTNKSANYEKTSYRDLEEDFM